MAVEEPASLRRLRESLSNLERLERQRGVLRERSERFEYSAPRDHLTDGQAVLNSKLAGRDDSIDHNRFGQKRLDFDHTVPPEPLAENIAPPGRPVPARSARHDATMDYGRSTSSRPTSARALVGRPAPSDAAALDAALTLALDQSQDRLEAAQHERDVHIQRAKDQEVEARRLSELVEQLEAENREVVRQHRVEVEDRRKEAEQHCREKDQLQMLKREHAEALAEIAALKRQAEETHSSTEERRRNLEALVNEQRERLDLLEEGHSRASDLSEALYMCLRERAAMLRFLAHTLQSQHSMLQDQPGHRAIGTFTRARQVAGGRDAKLKGNICVRVPSIECLGRNAHRPSCDRINHEAGSHCRARSRRKSASSQEAAARRAAGGGRVVVVPSELPAEIKDLISSLEAEIDTIAHGLKKQVHRVSTEAEEALRALSATPSEMLSHTSCNPELCDQLAQSREILVQRVCATWLENDRLRRSRASCNCDFLMPHVDWTEEQTQHESIIRGLVGKFAQLENVRHLMQAHQSTVRRASNRTH